MLVQKNSRKQGDVGLGAAIAYFTSIGATVCVPLTDNQDYDLVVQGDDGPLERVSVKTSRQEVGPGVFSVRLTVRIGNTKGYSEKRFEPKSADLLYILVSNGDQYVIPTHKILGQSVQVGRKWTEFRIDGRVAEGATLET